MSGRLPSPADEPGLGETREEATVEAFPRLEPQQGANARTVLMPRQDTNVRQVLIGPEDPNLDPGWHPDPANHPERTAVVLTPREAPWRSDSAQDVGPQVTGGGGPVLVKPGREGGSTLRVAYLFSGVSRRSSIATELAKLCRSSGIGLHVDEINIYNEGSSHDLLDPGVQAEIEKKIADAFYDVVIISPPCAT